VFNPRKKILAPPLLYVTDLTYDNSSVGLNTPTTSTLTTMATVVRHRNSSATRAQLHSHSCLGDSHQLSHRLL